MTDCFVNNECRFRKSQRHHDRGMPLWRSGETPAGNGNSVSAALRRPLPNNQPAFCICCATLRSHTSHHQTWQICWRSSAVQWFPDTLSALLHSARKTALLLSLLTGKVLIWAMVVWELICFNLWMVCYLVPTGVCSCSRGQGGQGMPDY